MKKNKYNGINDMIGWCSQKDSKDFSPYKKCLYKTWYNMLYRCFSEDYHKRNPTYKDCTCDKSWLIFSNFLKDVRHLDGFNQYIRALGKGYALDKDILGDGKHYSKSTCKFISKSLNSKECVTRHGYKNMNQKKPIIRIGSKGIDMVIFDGVLDAVDGVTFKASGISACCNGNFKNGTYKGYKFRFIDLEEL